MSERLLLAVDASTYSGSAALIRGRTVLAECTVAMRGEREERLMPAIASMLSDARTLATSLDGIVCGSGPGSFTSLRIAASIAKGLAVVLGQPLYAVPSLLLVATGAAPQLSPGRYAAVIDAMRGDVYAATAEVDDAGAGILVSPTEIVPAGSAATYAEARGATLVGPGVVGGLAPHARGVAKVRDAAGGEPAIVPVDVDLWEPNYGRLAEAQVRWEAAQGRALSQG